MFSRGVDRADRGSKVEGASMRQNDQDFRVLGVVLVGLLATVLFAAIIVVSATPLTADDSGLNTGLPKSPTPELSTSAARS
jgi:hypothetical protein